MKNIFLDNRVILCGKQWVSNLYCFNYGYRNHGIEEDNLYTDCYQEKVNGRLVNKFLDIPIVNKKEYVDSIKPYFCKSDYITFNIKDKEFIQEILSRIDYNEHDTVTLSYRRGMLSIGVGYTGSSNNVTNDDYSFAYSINVDLKADIEPVSCIVCSKAFKFTCRMYNIKDINFRIHSSQNMLRIDSGEYNEFGDNIFTLIKPYDFKNKDEHIKVIDSIKEVFWEAEDDEAI